MSKYSDRPWERSIGSPSKYAQELRKRAWITFAEADVLMEAYGSPRAYSLFEKTERDEDKDEEW